MQPGTNLPPALATPDEARAVVPAGSWLRFVAYDGLGDGLAALGAAGFKRLLVLTAASLALHPATTWRRMYGDRVDAIQCLNECDADPGVNPDGTPKSPSSDVMSQDALAEHLVDVSLAWPSDMPLIGPGLCSGDPGWWDADLNARCDAIAVHPYAKSAADAAALLTAYHDRWHTPIWVTEFLDPGANIGLLPDYLAAFRALPFVAVAINYGGSPAWANGFGGHVATFKFGNLAFSQAHPDLCGQPLTDEIYDAEGNSEQFTTTGYFKYREDINHSYFFESSPKG